MNRDAKRMNVDHSKDYNAREGMDESTVDRCKGNRREGVSKQILGHSPHTCAPHTAVKQRERVITCQPGGKDVSMLSDQGGTIEHDVQ
jgi:hypothetical protein